MPDKNIHTFIGCDSSYAEANTVLFGAPFDSTTSFRPGARFAMRTMRNESFGIETYSPYQDKDLTDRKIFDGGDLELPFGDPAGALAQIEEYTAEVLRDGKLPCMVGGEHLVTLGVVRAVLTKYPKLRIMHFDAHADLREDYLGQRLSHACVMRRIWEQTGDGRIHQFGIRSGDRAEFQWGRTHVRTCLHDFSALAESIKALRGYPVYLSIDLDVLDPSAFPGTGTPEAGGVTFLQLLQACKDAIEGLDIVGLDINELSPVYDPSGASTALACKLLRELLLMVQA